MLYCFSASIPQVHGDKLGSQRERLIIEGREKFLDIVEFYTNIISKQEF